MMNIRNAVDVEPVFVYYADKTQFVSKSESFVPNDNLWNYFNNIVHL
jgi:hypothetical protein